MSENQRSALVAQLGVFLAEIERRAAGVETGLSELVGSIAGQVPGSQYAGITVAHIGGRVSTPAATHEHVVLLDRIQERHREGPCLSAAWEHHTIRIDDMTAENRWPKYCQDAVAESPIRSVLSFELFVNDDVLGALNFYAEQPQVFDQDSIELGLMFATHVALAWLMLRRDEQFRSALASRDVIGQAKGVIMERFNVDAVQAFELLKRLSQNSNTKVIDVARRLIDAAPQRQELTRALQEVIRAGFPDRSPPIPSSLRK